MRIALITMPFVSMRRPSLQLGLLKELAQQAGWEAETFHLNLDFAAAIGTQAFEALSQHRGHLFGDWLFAADAFGAEDPDPDDRLPASFAGSLSHLLEDAGLDEAGYIALRRVTVPDYLDRIVREIDWSSFDLVGFSSTFQQTIASLALARRLKALHPGLKTVFGGANCEGEMGPELLRSNPCIDYVVVGEGDEAFPELLHALARGDIHPDLASVAVRDAKGDVVFKSGRPPFERLDDSPIPDYREYFDRAQALGLLPDTGRRLIDLPFESSRGCWWGQKHHCTFCGLNGSFMRFRSKSPARVAAELAVLARRHRSFQFEAVDNIADYRYLRTLFPVLAESGNSYQFFYEVKSNLDPEQLRGLKSAGMWRIQPGIESLSTPVLKLMRKGVTALQNVNLLRWSRYYGLTVGWNLLYGFPGEQEGYYAEQASLVPLLRHLQPPGGMGRIWMERFSPIYNERKSFSVARIEPEASYAFVYPRRTDLSKIAYFFDYALEEELPGQTYVPLSAEVTRWRESWKDGRPPELRVWSSPGFIQIEDRREPERPGTFTFEGDLAQAYMACMEEPVTAQRVAETMSSYDEGDVAEALDGFVARGVMMREDNRYLALAIPTRHVH